jgi:hypothetical protein
MQLYCPACKASFAGTQRCPQCAGLLLMPHECADALAPRPAPVPPRAPDRPAAAGRVFVGALFALGLYLALRKLTTGVVLATGGDADAWWASFEGLLAVCGAQAVAVTFGAITAAAGRSGGAPFGAAVGLVCGGLFLAAELATGAPPQDLVLYLQLGALLVVGAVAGVIAARVWGAVPTLELEIADRARLSSSKFMVGMPDEPARPTSWAKVMIGAVIALAAVALAEKLRFTAERYSEGALRVSSVGQARFIAWQFAALGVLVGGALAAAGTGAGARHGFISGALAAAGVLGLLATSGENISPVSFWLSTLGLGGRAANDPVALAATFGGVLFLGVLGGWLGGVLFPPLAPASMRKPPKLGRD